MLKLRVIQAEEGDCLLLMHEGDASATRVLIDGGLTSTYRAHLRPVLAKLAAEGGTLDLVVLSHVDSDHVRGLNAFFAELRDQQAEPTEPLIAVRDLWHNAFSETDDDGTITPRLRRPRADGGGRQRERGRRTLHRGGGLHAPLRARDRSPVFPANAARKGRPILAGKPVDPVAVGGPTVTVVGPTKAGLGNAIRAEWSAWSWTTSKPHHRAWRASPSTRPPPTSAACSCSWRLTTSVCCSPVTVAAITCSMPSKRSVCSTATARSRWMSSRSRTTAASETSPRIFDRVIASTYVVSANGRYGNPDLATLEMLLSSAKAAGRTFELVVTNRCASVDAFVRAHPPGRNGYTLKALPAGEYFIDVVL